MDGLMGGKTVDGGWMDRWMDGLMGGDTVDRGWMDGWMDGQMDRRVETER